VIIIVIIKGVLILGCSFILEKELFNQLQAWGPNTTGSIEARTITNIEMELKKGLYAPITMNGVVVVDGIVSSAFVEIPAIERLFLWKSTILAQVSLAYRLDWGRSYTS
jgi:hypothetical protein